LRTQLVATCVHYWRGAAKILVHVFAVLAVVGNEVVIYYSYPGSVVRCQ
jgi:hypothetical protein